jgi:peptidoglycan/LPS O-acetylase OafA/YrhL
MISIPARAERPPNQDNKLLGIELLRFLSSVAVLIFHYQHFAFVGTVETHFVASQQPFFSLFRLFYSYGFYGVEVFWCISGFIFFWKYSSVIANGTMTGYVFFVLRLSRLYPLHFVTLVFMALMQYVYFSQHSTYFVYPYNDLYHFLLQLGFASNWGVQRGDSFNGPIWSISIEVLVYALFFISLKYASKRTIFIGGVALAAALIQVFKVSEHPLFPCIMFFYLGCLTAIIYGKSTSGTMAMKLVTIAALVASLGIITLQNFVDIKAKFFLVVFTPSVILLCVTRIRETRVASRILVPAGNVTYASYLLHVPIQITVVTIFNYIDFAVPVYSKIFFVLFLVGTLALSHWVFEVFEMPAQRFVRRTLMPRRGQIPRNT